MVTIPAETDLTTLFHELVALEPAARAPRLEALADDVAQQIRMLIQADERAGDFLGVLRATDELDAPREAVGGDTIANRYRIERFLGRGAMGEVHLAHDLELDRLIALKFVHSSHLRNEMATGRFAIEARATARLDHPHVATVFDVGHDINGRLFIAMSYYPGQSLRDRMSNGALPLEDALRIAVQLADALSAAHAAGIVHRDVKPSNVLFDANDAVKLTDFGVAKLLEHDTTLPGAIVGTPGYMSPEQARGDRVDGRSDLWSLGATIFEMLTGQRPSSSPSPSLALLPDGPLRAIVSSLLSHDVGSRPQSAVDVVQALRRAQSLAAGAEVAETSTTALSFLRSLPSAVTSFVGREALLTLARTFLAQTRLMTLTGPGGTGKTRMAMQLATIVRASFADDMWFVSLAELTDAALVPSSVASAIGVRDTGSATLLDRTISALRTRHGLLVLDNFEHVRAARAFVARVLAECPQITMLVTSREPLALQGEQEFPVPPLSTPVPLASNVADSESVQLFVQRARAVRPGFVLDEESTEAVAEICRRLDGLPLALELAAARTKLLSPRAMLSRLEHRLDLLRVDAHDRPARHRTLREVIDWSYVLLTNEERMLFCWLSVFGGGISTDAAESVGRAFGESIQIPSSPVQVLDLLTSLCNKSLLRHEELANGETRFFFLETVREFALERLRESNSEPRARAAFRAWCLALAEHAANELRGPSQAEWIGRLQRDYANLRVALDESLADGASSLPDAIRFTLALHRLWATRGPLVEGAAYLKRVIDIIDSLPPSAGEPARTRQLPKLLNAAAIVASSQGLFRDMSAFLLRCLPMQRASGEGNDRLDAVAVTLNNLGWATWILGDRAAGRAMSSEALSIHEQRRNELGEALSHQNLAWMDSECGEYASAESHFMHALALHRKRNDPRSAAACLTWLGLVVAHRGDYARALDLHQQALSIRQDVAYQGFQDLHRIRIAITRHAMLEPGDHVTAVESTYLPAARVWGGLWPIAAGLSEMGLMLRDEGQLDRARAAFVEEIALRERMGARVSLALAHVSLASVTVRQGDFASADPLLTNAMAVARESGAVPVLIEALEVVALLAIRRAYYSEAAILLAAASQHRDRLGAPRSPRAERDMANEMAFLRESLGAGPFQDASQLGISIPLDDVIHISARVLRSL